MFCPHCGASDLGSDGLCQACGQKTTPSSLDLEPPLAEEGIEETCPNCGTPVGTDEVFCGQCGARVIITLNNRPAATENQGAKASTLRMPPTRRTALETASEHILWDVENSEEEGVATESYRRPQPARSSLRTSPAESFARHELTNVKAAERYSSTRRQPTSPAERPRTVLIISLFCFLASLISGAAAIWLAVSVFH